MDICGGFYRGKRVLVTGHTGFIGRWLFKVLDMAGASVVGYSIDVQTVDLDDIRNKSRLEQVFAEVQPEIVFHLAAQTDVDYAKLDPAGTYETNVMGVVNVLEASRKTKGVRSIVMASSNQIYEEKDGPWAYRENDTLVGRDTLTTSKICVESILKTYRNTFFKVYQGTALSSARFGNVFGGGDYR
ncbi:MAG: NAD-dependent epimerase/dehydratase family protein [Bacteroidales bacterium]|nr:NAD-dependent epimerase/dehydratase family protein [Bacteroidales bacterium]